MRNAGRSWGRGRVVPAAQVVEWLEDAGVGELAETLPVANQAPEGSRHAEDGPPLSGPHERLHVGAGDRLAFGGKPQPPTTSLAEHRAGTVGLCPTCLVAHQADDTSVLQELTRQRPQSETHLAALVAAALVEAHHCSDDADRAAAQGGNPWGGIAQAYRLLAGATSQIDHARQRVRSVAPAASVTKLAKEVETRREELAARVAAARDAAPEAAAAWLISSVRQRYAHVAGDAGGDVQWDHLPSGLRRAAATWQHPGDTLAVLQRVGPSARLGVVAGALLLEGRGRRLSPPSSPTLEVVAVLPGALLREVTGEDVTVSFVTDTAALEGGVGGADEQVLLEVAETVLRRARAAGQPTAEALRDAVTVAAAVG